MNKKKAIFVSEETKKKLFLIKYSFGFKDMEQVINKLIKKTEFNKISLNENLNKKGDENNKDLNKDLNKND